MNQVNHVLLVTTAIVMVMTSPVLGRRTPRCAGASEPDFSKLILNDKLHPTFYQMPSLQALVENSTTVPDEFKCPLYSYLQGSRQCPTWDAKVRQYGGTLCPSYHVINHDENRYPPTLVEARCSCESCMNHPDHHANLTELRCKPVPYYTPVFRRVGCAGNVYQYKQVWEPLTVACSCSAPNNIEVPPYDPTRPIHS